MNARLARDKAGNTLQTVDNEGLGDDTEEARAEIVVLAGREHFSDSVVDELFLRLQDAQVSRLIAKLKLTMKTDDTAKQAEELASLQAVRRRLREALRSIPVQEEPDEW